MRSSEAGVKMATSPASLPDDDNLLWEILLRLPSQSSSLLRASAVCKHWRCLVIDPQFLHRFRVHHRKPPIIGFFEGSYRPVFRSIMNPPVRIPLERLPLRRDSLRFLLGCRHGRALFRDINSKELIVCDPITGQRSHVAPPPELKDCCTVNGAVLCSADDDDQGHVHGSSCHSSPFKMVLVVSRKREDLQLIACVYSSKTGVWGNFITIAIPYVYFDICSVLPGVLAGKSLYWLLFSGNTIEFDLDRQSLTVIRRPVLTSRVSLHVIQVEDSGNIGLTILSYPSFQMWQRKVDCHGVSTWVPWKTIDMCSTLGFPPKVPGQRDIIVGYAEDAGVIFLNVAGRVYMVHLESMQARRLHDQASATPSMGCFPLTSFHAAGDCSSLGSHWWWI